MKQTEHKNIEELSDSEIVRMARAYLHEDAKVFANRFGVSESAISRWENENRGIQKSVVDICKKLLPHLNSRNYDKELLERFAKYVDKVEGWQDFSGKKLNITGRHVDEFIESELENE